MRPRSERRRARSVVLQPEAHPAGVAQLAAVAAARDQELIRLPAVARPPGGDRQSLAVAVLVLAPGLASTAGLVGRVQALGHHPLQVAIAGDCDQVLVDREGARRPPRRPLERQRLQQRPPLPVGQSPGGAAGEVQNVEDDQRRRRRHPRRRDRAAGVGHAAASAAARSPEAPRGRNRPARRRAAPRRRAPRRSRAARQTEPCSRAPRANAPSPAARRTAAAHAYHPT